MVILRRRRVPELRNGPLGKLRGRNFPESNEATRLICVNLRPLHPGEFRGCGWFVSLCLCGKIQRYLNFCLSILSALMRDSKVEGGT